MLTFRFKLTFERDCELTIEKGFSRGMCIYRDRCLSDALQKVDVRCCYSDWSILSQSEVKVLDVSLANCIISILKFINELIGLFYFLNNFIFVELVFDTFDRLCLDMNEPVHKNLPLCLCFEDDLLTDE